MYGVIVGFNRPCGSGLATIYFADGTSARVESGFGLRQLAFAFNGSLLNARGQGIEYDVDEFGLMVSFEPVEEEAA